jgi:hypothetical protein
MTVSGLRPFPANLINQKTQLFRTEFVSVLTRGEGVTALLGPSEGNRIIATSRFMTTYNSRHWTKSTNPVILTVIYRPHMPLDSTSNLHNLC